MPARILLIEDNPTNLELMNYLLEAYGYAPTTAKDGGAGLAAAQAAPFDLIVCDIQMPVLDGYEVARRLKADPALQAIPLVAVTALAMVGDRDKVLAAGFDGYIAKPIEPETFVPQVEAYLRLTRRAPAPTGDTSVAPARAQPVPPRRLTVLVVDNSPVNLVLARDIFEPHGFQVLTAETMQQALALARQQPCDLILSDVCMNGHTGYDFIRLVKADAQLAAIPFVFLTSSMIEERDRALGLALGAARFLFRPIEPDVLLAEIETCIRESGRLARGDHSDR